MKITRSSDWRDALPFEIPLRASDAVPGEHTRCAGCGADSPVFAREDLWVVKHRHPNNHAGFVRFYCTDHRPQLKVAAAPVTRRETARRERVASTPRHVAPVVERPATLCPDCFVEVPATGVCGMCGQRVA